MCVHIAIPEPTSIDSVYNHEALPAYLSAIRSAGALAVIVPLHESQERVAKLLHSVQGVLLPGSRFDIDPQIYGEERRQECSPSDAARRAVDEVILQEAFCLKKPVLAICGGMQSLNVWRNGALFQDLKSSVNHRAGREVLAAHQVQVVEKTRLCMILPKADASNPHVNSMHHQAVDRVGDNLRVAAFSPQDQVVEAIELDSPDHFVLGVQWHPERTYATSAFSRAIFAAFVQAATVWEPRPIAESVVAA
jgi:putative glutamine amidotransferase